MKKHQALMLTGTALTLVAAGGGLMLTQAHQEPVPPAAQEIAQAPAPATEFMDYQCPPPEQIPQDVDLAPGSWYLSLIHI